MGEFRGESEGEGRGRIAVGFVLAVLLHVCVIALLRAADSNPEGGVTPGALDLQIVDGVAARPRPEEAEALPVEAGRQTRAGRSRGATAAVGNGAPSSSGADARSDEARFEPGARAPASADEADAGPLGGGDGARDVKLALDWNGFERAFAERAMADREALVEQRSGKLARGSGFGRWNRLVLRALGDNRRFGPEGAPVDGAGARLAVADYLAVLNGRITPAFNSFLYAVGSPNDLLHGKVQRGPLRYNPFYVPPPPGEVPDTSSPLARVSRPARAEFSLLPSGALDDVHLVATSGSSFFDASAVASICEGAPFPPPPRQLVSAGDRAFFAWRFDKDWHKNGPASARHIVVRSPADEADAAVATDSP